MTILLAILIAWLFLDDNHLQVHNQGRTTFTTAWLEKSGQATKGIKNMELTEYKMPVTIKTGDIFSIMYCGKPTNFVFIGCNHLGYNFIRLSNFMMFDKVYNHEDDHDSWWPGDVAEWVKRGEANFIGNVLAQPDVISKRIASLKKSMEIN